MDFTRRAKINLNIDEIKALRQWDQTGGGKMTKNSEKIYF